jgi:hypothetical protein
VKRTTTLLLSALLAGSLSACGAGTSGAGVAARIGKDVIELDELEKGVTDALAERPSQSSDTRVQATRATLGRMINTRIYEAAADELDVEVSAAEVDERITALEEQFGGSDGLIQQAKGLGIPITAIPEVVRGELLRERIGDALIRDLKPSSEQVRALDSADVAHILVETRAEAVRIIDALKKGGSFAALAKQFSTDPGSKDQGGVYANTRRGQFVPPFDKAVWSGKVGAVQGPVQTEFGFHVIKVIKRVTKTLDKLTPEERAQVLGTQRDQLLAEFLSDLSERLRIRVNPRFGSWNAEAGRLDAPKDDLSQPEGGGVGSLDPNAPPGGNPSAVPTAPTG